MMEQANLPPAILFVDDEEYNLISFRAAFRKEYKIFTANSGLAAMQILKEHPIQLVITDQRMPGMTGVEFLTAILPLYPNLVTIILTGFSDIEAIINAINKCRIFRYITKPWDEDDLRKDIESALQLYNLQNKNRTLLRDLKETNARLEEYNLLLEQKVEERTKALEESHSQISASIRYAKTIQEAMLSYNQQFLANFHDHFILYNPRDMVSGDFYWFSKKHNKTIVAAVDCTGHGVPGAFMSLIGNGILSQVVNERGFVEPDEVLYELQVGVRKALRQHETDNKDGMDIALCVIDKEAGIMKYAGAKIPLYLFQNGELNVIKPDKISIGGMQEGRRKFNKVIIDISVPSTFYLCSDGYQDQFGGLYNKKFMVKRFKQLLYDIHNKPMEDQRILLEKNLSEWMGADNKQVDDVLVIGVKI
jgi:phosphoserine phosphatase RsbU/P